MKMTLFVILLFCSSFVQAAEKSKKNEPDIKLESVFIGDKEQPSVSYFIPWQGIGTPDKLQWNIDSKYDNTLEVVDRDVMLRSSTIYNEMKLEINSTVNK